MTSHYLDNSATTPVCNCSRDAVNKALDCFGNPSSLHSAGFEAEKLIEGTRNAVLRSISPKAVGRDTLIFTSGGTEANNLAIIGCAQAKARNKGKKIIVGETEHPSVLEAADYLGTLGYKIVKIPAPLGVWDMNAYTAALDGDTLLVSAMLVNNETGAVNDIKAISRLAKIANPDVIIHCDAVQGFFKLGAPMPYGSFDMMTVSSHKINGPKGTGALYVSYDVMKKKALVPVVHGGGQEGNLRSGTENVPGICGFGAAAEYHGERYIEDYGIYSALYSRLEEKILSLPSEYGVKINKPQSACYARHIMNITVPGIPSETTLHYLSEYGIFVSSGSACSSNTGHVSHVLLSYGLTEQLASSSIRVSLGPQNTNDDIDALYDALLAGIPRLQKKGKLN